VSLAALTIPNASRIVCSASGGQRGGAGKPVGDEPDQHVHHEIEIGRLSAVLADEFSAVEREAIEEAVRVEFERRANAPVTDFVALFVERDLRRRLRATTDEQ
jgi:hypothetical protein